MSPLDKAVQLLNLGKLVAIPTETVYGLAARIDSQEALENIFKVKNRPFFDPLIVHVNSLEQAKSLASDWPPIAQILAKKFWPGPLTLVLNKSSRVSNLITSGLQTVGIRMPKHKLALELINKVGVPLAAPSANKFGKISPTCAAHVKADFLDAEVFVLDGGDCEVGIESTVLAISGDHQLSVLRAGLITQSQIQQALEEVSVAYQFSEKIQKGSAPGQMKHHYMPSVPLVLVMQENFQEKDLPDIVKNKLQQLPAEIEGVEIVKPKKFDHFKQLVLPKEPYLAARAFYQQLRDLAAQKPDFIYMKMTKDMDQEIWSGLKDRLMKAASLKI